MKLNELSCIFRCSNIIFFHLFFIFTYLPTRFLAVISKRNTEKTCNGLSDMPYIDELSKLLRNDTPLSCILQSGPLKFQAPFMQDLSNGHAPGEIMRNRNPQN